MLYPLSCTKSFLSKVLPALLLVLPVSGSNSCKKLEKTERSRVRVVALMNTSRGWHIFHSFLGFATGELLCLPPFTLLQLFWDIHPTLNKIYSLWASYLRECSLVSCLVTHSVFSSEQLQYSNLYSVNIKKKSHGKTKICLQCFCKDFLQKIMCTLVPEKGKGKVAQTVTPN